LSLALGTVLGIIFSILARRFKDSRDIYILIFSTVLVATGLSLYLHLSLILTNMILGLVVVNTQPSSFVEKTRVILTEVMPLLFVLFFVLAGVNLHVAALPSLGLVGFVYMLCRSLGLVGGAWVGAALSKAESKIRKYLGLGILSQAGVAIGLSLIVKQEFTPISEWGARIGTIVLTTVTATSIVFEIIGPILTKIGLEKAGEIRTENGEGDGS
jgi:Kef-type K+ transport system membrane component KefB